MGLATKAVTDVHCKGEQHKYWLPYGNLVPEYLPRAAPTRSTALLGMMSRLNERPVLRAAARTRGVWAAATMAALAHLRPDVEPNSTNKWLDAKLESGVPRPDKGQYCPCVLPKQVTTLSELRRMYPMMHSTYKQPPWQFRDACTHCEHNF